MGEALAARRPPLPNLCGAERRDQAATFGGHPMIPPVAAVLNRLLYQAWKTLLWGALIAGVAEWCGIEVGNA